MSRFGIAFSGFEADRPFAVKYLALFLAAVLVIGAFAHYTGVGSDPYGVIHFAQHLSRGRFYSDYPVYGWFKPDWNRGSHMVLYGNYQLRDGRMFCKYTIGYSLLLAASLRIFGPDSIYLFNVFVLAILLLVLYLFAREALPERPGRDLLALAAPALLLVLVPKIWDTAVKPVHDLPALLLLVGGLYAGVRALRNLPRVSWPLLALSSAALGFSGSFRLPNVLVALPAGGYLLSRLIGRAPLRRIGLVAAVAVLFFALGLLPALVQNQLTTGHPLKPPRPEVVEKKAVKIDDLWHPPPLWIGFFPHTFPRVMEFFWEEYGLFFSCLVLLGAGAGRRKAEIGWLGVGVPLVFILFYSCWVHLMARYMMVAEPFLVLLAVSGIGRLLAGRLPRFLRIAAPAILLGDLALRIVSRLPYGLAPADLGAVAAGAALCLLMWVEDLPAATPARIKVFALVLLAAFLAAKGPLLVARRELFQLPEAHRFGRDLDRLVPSGSVVFATKPLTQLIELFTSSHSIRPFDLERMGVSLRAGVNYALSRSVGVYLIDHLATGKEPDAAGFVPVLREDFDLVPVGTLRAQDYNLRPQFGRDVCTVFRVEHWSRDETDLEIPIASTADDCLLTLYARALWAPDLGRTRLAVELNGRPLAAEITDGVNFIPLPREILAAPLSRLVLSSDRPLPRLMEAAVQDVWRPYTVDIGRRAKVNDRYFISDFFDLGFGDGHFRRLAPGKAASVLVPFLPIEETVLVGEVKVDKAQAKPRPLSLSVRAGTAAVAAFDLSSLATWDWLVFPLPPGPLRGTLTFTAEYPDRPQMGYKEKKAGALLVGEVSVLRWLKKASLPTPSPGFYFAAFHVRSDPSFPSLRGPCAVLCGGSSLAAASPDAITRAIISPERISVPETVLTLAPPSVGRPLFGERPFLLPAGQRLAFAVGAEEDWAFLGEGFHPPELHLGKTPVRWTSQTAVFHVPLFPGEGRTASVVFRVVPIRPAASLPAGAAARLYEDGNDLGAVPLSAAADSLAWTIPLDSPQPRVAALTLSLPPWRPSDFLASTDDRVLGLMLEGVEIEYGAK